MNNGLDGVRNSITSLQERQNTFNTDLKANATKCDTLSNELKDVRFKLENTKRQLNEVIGISIKRDQEICECKNKLEAVQKQVARDVLRLTGIIKKDGESIAEKVGQFFKNTLQITKDIVLADAYRVGKTNPRTIVVHLQNYRDRGLIFGHCKKLKDVTNEEGKSYGVKEHFTAKAFADQQRKRKLIQKSKKQTTANKLEISFEKSKLKVAGKEYVKGVKVPSVQDILKPSTKALADRLKLDVHPGDEIMVEKQIFQGYAVDVKSLEEVESAYCKVVSLNSSARHVVAAWRLPGENYAVLQDFHDHDEHGMGDKLLQLMGDSLMFNKAIFVARFYDGTHIGVKRIGAFMDAARSAIINSPMNNILGKHQYLLSRAEQSEAMKAKFSSSIRGRRPHAKAGYSGTGGRGRADEMQEQDGND